MGIHGLMKLLSGTEFTFGFLHSSFEEICLEECPDAIKEIQDMESLTGRKVAIDASMALYQFLVAVRSAGGPAGAAMQLMNEAGDVTSHIQGMFNRTIKMMTSGIKPVYVFDGKPPHMKGGELAKRMARRAKAEADLVDAQNSENVDDVDKFSRRLVRVTKQHNEECRELLGLMGVPFVIAPCEAEAQCAELARKGKVYATATEDMDALTFRTPKLLRRFTHSQGKDKQSILEIDLESVLRGLELSYEQFVDLCILCGCDYCSTIKGIGPKTALKLIKEHKTLDEVVKQLKKSKKYEIPPDWYPMLVPKGSADDDNEQEPEDEAEAELDAATPEEPLKSADSEGAEKEAEAAENDQVESAAADIPAPEEPQLSPENCEEVPPLFEQARGLFVNAEVTDGNTCEFKWEAPNEAGLRTFLVEKMGFNEERVNNAIKRLQEAQKIKSQQRMDSFFAPVASSNGGVKRKAEEPKGKGKPGKKVASAGFRKK